MNKEQYNSFDDWFRAAAAQPGPPVHDAAWQAMEAKLDGQKKKRRALIFWWWFGGLFLAGGIFLVARMNNEAVENRSRANIELPVKKPVEKPNNATDALASKPSEHTIGIKRKEKSESINTISSTGESLANDRKTGNSAGIRLNPENEESSSTGNIKIRKQKSSFHKTEPKSLSLTSTIAANSLPKNNEENDNVLKTGQDKLPAKDSLANDTSSLQNEKSAEQAVVSKDSTSPKKPSKSPQKPSRFYVFGAAAPEWSYVKNRSAGDVSLSYGLGIGYSFSKKWAIQAGVFLAGKKYVAGEGDYTPKQGSYYDNPNIKIESVDADCSVLEIPLSMRFTFLQKKKYQFFAIASFTSTVMKKETYDYDYLDSLGAARYYLKTYKTGAFNLFSTATLSVGMESRLNKNFSLLFVPYFNIPLQGIGEGKVYINSFGVQGGLKYNLPF